MYLISLYVHIALVSSSLKLFSLRFCRFQGSPLERLNIVVVICARWLDDEKKKFPFKVTFTSFISFLSISESHPTFSEKHKTVRKQQQQWVSGGIWSVWKRNKGSRGCEVSAYWQVRTLSFVILPTLQMYISSGARKMIKWIKPTRENHPHNHSYTFSVIKIPWFCYVQQ